MHVFHCPLRWGDMDAQAHVNNGAYVDYLQEARVDYLLTGPAALHPMLAAGVLVVSHQVEYLAPVVFSERRLRIAIWVEQVGGSRFTLAYRVHDGDTLVLRARTGLAAYDVASDRLRRLSEAERAALRSEPGPAETGLSEIGLSEIGPLRELPPAAVGDRGHRHPFWVRWSDLDSYGHVNNVRFFDYVQEARVSVLREVLGWRTDDVWLVVRQDIVYRRPLDFALDPYEVRTRVTDVGRRSFTLAAAILDPGTGAVFADVRTVVVSRQPLDVDRREGLRGLA